MKVHEFIEWLKTQDQEATIEVVEHTTGRGWYDQGGNALVVEFDPARHADYTDMRGNQFAVGKPYQDARTLLLGMKDG